MELLALSSPKLRTSPSSSSPKVSSGKPRFPSCRGLTFPGSNRYPDGLKLKFLYFRAQASGVTNSNQEKLNVIKQEVQKKDKDLAFVAGATGKVGSRAVRELLKLGFRVRGGVRSAQKAESLVQSVRQMEINTEGANRETQPVEKLEIVECDLENQDMIIPAIGNASVVLCCIGASEKEVFDITGPYRIDYQATKNLIDAATVAQVDHFILLTSLGTNKIGFPAAILNLFWGVLIWKRKAEEVLIASGLPYTIVRPGGMERPTDAYKETHNITLATEDTLFGGQVSNLQVAELMASMAKNRGLSYCKVVEVIAETTAPLLPMEELLAKIPSQRVDSSTSEGFQDATLPGPSPEAKSTAIEEEQAQAKAQLTKPLSPYFMYEDLKPPTSPAPTPSTTPGVTKTSYDDLKPPTSPTATPSGSKEGFVGSAPPVGVVSPSTVPSDASKSATIQMIGKDLLDVPAEEKSHLSPYYAYDDLKPPTSPSPSVPTTSMVSASSADGAPPLSTTSDNSSAQPPALDKPLDEQHCTEPKPRPLSPFAMYADLKPLTSPSPSVPTTSLVSASSADGAPPLSTTSGNDSAQPVALDRPVDKQHSMEPKSKPLSPFSMYEDLKPPTSPIPSPKKS